MMTMSIGKQCCNSPSHDLEEEEEDDDDDDEEEDECHKINSNIPSRDHGFSSTGAHDGNEIERRAELLDQHVDGPSAVSREHQTSVGKIG